AGWREEFGGGGVPVGLSLLAAGGPARRGAGACRRPGRCPGEPVPATRERECPAGAFAPVAHHLGHGNGRASPKAFSSMVAPTQFRGPLTRKFGVPSQNPRSFSYPARPLWHALDDDGGGRRRGCPCPRTEWCCSPLKVSRAAWPHAISLPASPH